MVHISRICQYRILLFPHHSSELVQRVIYGCVCTQHCKHCKLCNTISNALLVECVCGCIPIEWSMILLNSVLQSFLYANGLIMWHCQTYCSQCRQKWWVMNIYGEWWRVPQWVGVEQTYTWDIQPWNTQNKISVDAWSDDWFHACNFKNAM